MTAARVFFCGLVLSGTVIAADPPFTGKWQLDEGKSELRGLPEKPPSSLTLDLQGSAMACEDAVGKCSFTIDRKESRVQDAEGSRSRVAKWEGDAIILNTIVLKRGGQHSEVDRWSV